MEARSVHPLPPSAAPVPPAYPPYSPIIILLTIILLVFFCGFFAIYFSRCFMENIPCTWHLWEATSGTTPPGGATTALPLGLDLTIVKSFPTFTYSSVKEYRKEKYGLECAICLIEFQGTDLLRLLTTCYHVFHQECIDLWLELHKTCPVCRKNLESRVQSPAKSPCIGLQENEQMRDSFRITINDDGGDDRITVGSDHKVHGAEGNGDHGKIEHNRFSRSHSTGHSSVVVNREIRERDRYTLILPEHVTLDIINRRGHNPSQSWPTYGEEYRAHESNNNANNINGPAEVSGVKKNV